MGLSPVLEVIPEIESSEVAILREMGIVTPTMLESSNFDALNVRLKNRIEKERFKELQKNVNKWQVKEKL